MIIIELKESKDNIKLLHSIDDENIYNNSYGNIPIANPMNIGVYKTFILYNIISSRIRYKIKFNEILSIKISYNNYLDSLWLKNIKNLYPEGWKFGASNESLKTPIVKRYVNSYISLAKIKIRINNIEFESNNYMEPEKDMLLLHNFYRFKNNL